MGSRQPPVLARSYSLVEGLLNAFDTWNLVVAVPILRMQIDKLGLPTAARVSEPHVRPSRRRLTRPTPKPSWAQLVPRPRVGLLEGLGACSRPSSCCLAAIAGLVSFFRRLHRALDCDGSERCQH